MRSLDVDIGDSAPLAISRERLVLVWWLGVLGDDVPGVQQAGDQAENAEEDVDQGVCAADTAFDPDYKYN